MHCYKGMKWMRWVFLAGAVSFAAQTYAAGREGRRTWISVGPVLRAGMELSVAPVVGAGSLGGYADRFYRDGYVKKDPGTGTPGAMAPDSTWNWGYENASQVGTDTLTFHGIVGDPGDDCVTGGGAEISGGVELGYFGKSDAPWGSFSLAAGLQFVYVDGQRVGYDVTDTYDTRGMEVPPGYHGTFLGPFDTPAVTPSPLLPNVPMSRVATGEELDFSFLSLWVGPRLDVYPCESVALYVMPRVALNGGRMSLASAGTEYQMDIGFGVVAGLEAEFDRWLVSLYAGYDWQPDAFHVTGAGYRVEMDPSGFTCGLSVGRTF